MNPNPSTDPGRTGQFSLLDDLMEVFGSMEKQRFVVQKINERIAAGSLPAGQMLPSERRLSAEFGVSRTSVQAALRELESLGVLSRQPNCRPIVTAAKGREKLIVDGADQIAVWILPDLQDMGGTVILQSISTVLASHGYRVLIGCPPSYAPDVVKRSEIEFLQSISENPSIAGAIIWDTGNLGCIPIYQSLADRGFPIVFIDREPPFEIAADMVATNNRRAAQNAVRYLLQLGHERIAMVVGLDRASSVHDRIAGYRSALAAANPLTELHPLFELPLDPAKEAEAASERVLTRILDDPNAFTAIFAVNDKIALHLFEAAKSLRVSIPEQISLVGFDWLMRWLPSGGDLTTIAQPFEEIGRTAAHRVLTRIASTNSEPPRHILLDASLVLKHSAGLPFDKPSLINGSKRSGEIYESAPKSRIHSY